MTILYIDDDSEDREFFREAVQNIDATIQCFTAEDGAAGMEALREMIIMPDFIFVDVNMPVMNGKQFLIEIKKQTGFRSIPVVIYSTTSHPLERDEYICIGAYKVLVKPNSLTKITSLVRSVIRNEPIAVNR